MGTGEIQFIINKEVAVSLGDHAEVKQVALGSSQPSAGPRVSCERMQCAHL